MQIRTCQAKDLKSLMEKMRRLYGPDAVLMSVRRLGPSDDRDEPHDLIEGTVASERAQAATAAPGSNVRAAAQTPPTPPFQGGEITSRAQGDAKGDIRAVGEQPGLQAGERGIHSPPLEKGGQGGSSARGQSHAKHSNAELDAAQNLPSDFSHTPSNAACESLSTLQVVALVGPMGAGKTTTAAKIAGRLAQLRNQPVGVISTDTDRPGGSALLAAYAQELQLCMTTAPSAPDLQNRLSRWNCRGPLVIDTRGYSPRDGLAIERLGELLSANTMNMQRYLVLSATEHPAVARECLDAYGAIGLHGVVLTRVDQAAGIGHCLAEVRKSGLPIAFIGTGERVPADLREPSPTSLLALENSARNVLVS